MRSDSFSWRHSVHTTAVIVLVMRLFSLRLFLGRFGRCITGRSVFCACRFLLARIGCRRRVLLRPFFVRRTPIISNVEPRAFEDEPCACAEQPFHFAVPPLCHLTVLLRTLPKRLVPHRLKSVEILPAFVAMIFVIRHS